jgi:WD40 repeat protein
VLYHDSMVNDVFLTMDLGYLFSASDDTTAKIWKYDYGTKKYFEIASLNAHTCSIQSIYYYERMKILVTGDSNGLVRVWINNQLENKFKQIQTIQSVNPVKTLTIRFDNILCQHLLVIGTEGKKIKTYKLDITTEEHNQHTQKVKFTPFSVFESADVFAVSKDMSMIVYQTLNDLHKIKISKYRNLPLLPESYGLFQVLINLFVDESNFISKSAFHELINHIKANPMFYDKRKIHSDINIVLLAVISGYSDVLKVVLKSFGYEEHLYTSRFKPLEFALKRSNI